MANNEQLQSIIRAYTQQQYNEPDAKDRPDLFLAGNILKQHLLVEFKRPSDAVGRDAGNQPKTYVETHSQPSTITPQPLHPHLPHRHCHRAPTTGLAH